MADASVLENVTEITQKRFRPVLRSFDSGYEHSLEHLMAVQKMVEEADEKEEPITPAWFYALGVKA